MRLATQEELSFLFILIGQALLKVQILEECLSISITLKADVKHPCNFPKTEADKLLKKRRTFTFGNAIKEARKKKLYTDSLQKELETFLKERNWLVHKSIDDIYAPAGKHMLFQRFGSIMQEAHRLQRAIEDDLIEFSESIGLDMSHVRAAIKQ